MPEEPPALPDPACAASPRTAPQVALGLDWGERRIGVAAGDTLTRSARPLGTVPALGGRTDWAALDRYVRDWQPAVVVVGIPYNMDGTPGRTTDLARAFAGELAKRTSARIVTVDERLSSREAEDLLRRQRASGERRRRVRAADVDPVAACVLLEQWLRASDAPLPAE